MSEVQCDHCGQRFRMGKVDGSRGYFCCAGCALRARVPVDGDGNFPINAELISALVVGFLYFNQLLDWSLGAWMARAGKTLLAHRFAFAGVVLAISVWAGLAWLQFRARPVRGKDFVVTAVSLSLIAASFRSAPPAAGLQVAANALLLIWSFRGVFRPAK